MHEAGHRVGPASPTGVATPAWLALQGDGGVTHAERHVIHQRSSELAAALAVDMAGRAAERVVFGEASAGAGGAADSDLARATTMAVAMEGSWGLGERLSWLGDPETIAARLRLDPPLAARVEDHLRRAEERALRILQAQRPTLKAIATALRDRGLLQGTALEELMSKVRPEPAPRKPGDVTGEMPAVANRLETDEERTVVREADWSAPYRPLDRAA